MGRGVRCVFTYKREAEIHDTTRNQVIDREGVKKGRGSRSKGKYPIGMIILRYSQVQFNIKIMFLIKTKIQKKRGAI